MAQYTGDADAQLFIDALSKYERKLKKEAEESVARVNQKEAEAKVMYRDLINKKTTLKKLHAEKCFLQKENTVLTGTLNDLTPMLKVYEDKVRDSKQKLESCQLQSTELQKSLEEQRGRSTGQVNDLYDDMVEKATALRLSARASQQDKVAEKRGAIEEEVFSLEAIMAEKREEVRKLQAEMAAQRCHGVTSADRQVAIDLLRSETSQAKKAIVQMKLDLHKLKGKLRKN